MGILRLKNLHVLFKPFYSLLSRAFSKENLYFLFQISIFSIFRNSTAHILETQLQKSISIFNPKSLFIIQIFNF